MGIFSFLKRKQASGLSWAFLPGQIIIPDDKSITYIDRGYKQLPNVYAIISLIADKSSIVPFEALKVKDKGKARKYHAMMKSVRSTQELAKALYVKNQAFDKVEGSPLEELLINPNKYQSTEELFKNIDGYLLLTGNSYMWGISPGMGANAKKVQELHCLIAPTVSVKTSKDVFDPVEAYVVNYFDQTIPKEDVGHLKMFNPLSSVPRPEQLVYGLSPLASCRTLLKRYALADNAQAFSFQNMGIAGLISSEDGDITEDQAKDMQDNFTNFHTGVENANKIKVTTAKVKWTDIGLSPVDLRTIEGKEEILGELCNVYHVPIGMFTKVNSTENNMVESRKMFITDAVVPLVEKRKSVINRWLAPKFSEDVFIEFDYSVFAEMNEDMEKLARAITQMYWTTPNEKRAATNYDVHPDPLMDKIYMPSGNVPIEDLNMEVPEVDTTVLDGETN